MRPAVSASSSKLPILPFTLLTASTAANGRFAASSGPIPHDADPEAVAACFESCFSRERIEEAFRDNVAHRSGRGLDRIDARSFETRLSEHVNIVYRKVLDGTYEFTPYLEQFRPKGRDKPRVVSVPTVRDRLVLFLLKDFLHIVFPDCVARQLPNAVVRELCANLGGIQLRGHCVYRTDIKEFYDSVQHDPLLQRLRTRIPVPAAMTLLRRALRTPTVAPHARRATRPKNSIVGIPQGLSISNVLANIALADFDQAAGRFGVARARYVDDLLFVVPEDEAKLVQTSVEESLSGLGLRVNSNKTFCEPAYTPFDFLGYRFTWPRVSVRPDRVDGYIRRIAGVFTAYRHHVQERERPAWLTDEMLAARYLDEVNLHITGAVSGDRRYGWLFFFLEITDTELLHRLDGVIRRLARRAPAFPHASQVKRLVQAYYEARHRPRGGYIHNYDTTFAPIADQRMYLGSRGYVSPADLERMADAEVVREFQRIRERRLAALERDVGSFS